MGQVKDEIVDVMDYLLRLSDVLGVDLDQAVRQKIRKNAIKYPANPIREYPNAQRIYGLHMVWV